MDRKQYLGHVKEANYKRAEYLLNHYLENKGLTEKGLSQNVSQAFLDIISFQLSRNEEFSESDKRLLDMAGPYLKPIIDDALKRIQSFPEEIAQKIYPVLYYYYFNELTRGSIDKTIKQLEINEDMQIGIDELTDRIVKGTMMVAILLFDDRDLNAIMAGLS